MPNVQAMKDS